MAITRRTFSRTVGLGLIGAAIPGSAQHRLNVRVGHTGITWPWGNAPGGPARLTGPDPIAEVVRDISALGDRAVWAAMVLLLASGTILVASLAFMLRRIAVNRIEAMRAHLGHTVAALSQELATQAEV